MNVKFCSSCGEKMTQPSNFCKNCGRQFSVIIDTNISNGSEETHQVGGRDVRTQRQTRTKKYRYIILIIASVITVYLLLSMNHSPEKVAEKFVGNMYNLKFNELEKYLSPNADNWLLSTLQSMEDSMNQDPEYAEQLKREGYTIKETTISDVDIQGNKASVNIYILLENDEHLTSYIILENDSGEWKVVEFEF